MRVVIGCERTCLGDEGKDPAGEHPGNDEAGPDAQARFGGRLDYFQLFLLKFFLLVTRVAAALLEVFSALAAGFAGEIFFSAIPSHLLESLAAAPWGSLADEIGSYL
ncbi:MAG: hypothetical protein M3O84_09155 [Actinomycetota bacterium]|nr:hypothetical protein [Actinomycetota bacterium]